jgi:hypothetical protein
MIEVEGGEGGRDGSSSGLGGRRGRLHVPSRFDNNSLYNSLSLATSDPSWVISAPSQVVCASTCSHTIAWTTRD